MKIFTYSLIIIPFIWIGFRVTSAEETEKSIISSKKYRVTYEFNIENSESGYRVTSFLPQNSFRQSVQLQKNDTLSADIQTEKIRGNSLITWKGNSRSDTTITLSFEVKTSSVKYQITDQLAKPSLAGIHPEFTIPSDIIQSTSSKIKALNKDLGISSDSSVMDIIRKSFNFVLDIPSSSISDLTDALTCLQDRECSCNGKSRLLVAMLRHNNIPARMVGGLILNEGSKRTSHAWVEAYIGKQWVPFDALNDHFASLPAYYLKIYEGDEFLITRNTGYQFDYMYHIKEIRKNDYKSSSLLNIWEMIDSGAVPKKPFLLLLLLPLGALIVGIFKNVIGLQTYGVFLPVLLAFAFIEMGATQGLLFFTSIVVCISLMSFPLDKWGILHTPKMIVMLITVAIYSLVCMNIFFKTGWVDPYSTLMFPVIILTMIAEKFARKIDEDSVKEALSIYGQTLLVTMCCMWILSAEIIQHFFITFPEILCSLAGFGLLLGKWIGLRVTEYARFGNFDTKKIEASHVK